MRANDALLKLNFNAVIFNVVGSVVWCGRCVWPLRLVRGFHQDERPEDGTAVEDRELCQGVSPDEQSVFEIIWSSLTGHAESIFRLTSKVV
ncbi:uncharacterized protein LOC143191685 isoform X2 [Rhynchophorus ferrugineus]|uniref:uncharacterized protein LOC143191685 isoform X2 n=1 Tax=Rhynchophorus ferrugineus TaxID=354439 RepID=UPI003FCEC96B